MADHRNRRLHPGMASPAAIEPSTVHLAQWANEGSAAPLIVAVPFTTVRETRAALAMASGLADGLHAVIVLIAPETVPWQLPLDRSPATMEAWERRMCRKLDIHQDGIVLERILCRERDRIWTTALAPFRVIICGGKSDSTLGRLAAQWQGRDVEFLFAGSDPKQWTTRLREMRNSFRIPILWG